MPRHEGKPSGKRVFFSIIYKRALKQRFHSRDQQP